MFFLGLVFIVDKLSLDSYVFPWARFHRKKAQLIREVVSCWSIGIDQRPWHGNRPRAQNLACKLVGGNIYSRIHFGWNGDKLPLLARIKSNFFAWQISSSGYLLTLLVAGLYGTHSCHGKYNKVIFYLERKNITIITVFGYVENINNIALGFTHFISAKINLLSFAVDFE